METPPNGINSGLGGQVPSMIPPSGAVGDQVSYQYPQLGGLVNQMVFQYPQRTQELHYATDSQTQERMRIADRLAGFNPKDNYVWSEIQKKFGPNIKHGELLSIAQIISQTSGIKLDRDAKRRKSVLIKWFEENWPKVSPFLDYVVLDDVPGQE